MYVFRVYSLMAWYLAKPTCFL